LNKSVEIDEILQKCISDGDILKTIKKISTSLLIRLACTKTCKDCLTKTNLTNNRCWNENHIKRRSNTCNQRSKLLAKFVFRFYTLTRQCEANMINT